MSDTLTIERTVHFDRRQRGARKELKVGPDPTTGQPWGRLPRITKLMALALRFERLLSDGDVEDYRELARLGHVSKARISQVMNLCLLAPSIQEEILFLPRIEDGRDPITLRDLQPITLTPDWEEQNCLWEKIVFANTMNDPSDD